MKLTKTTTAKEIASTYNVKLIGNENAVIGSINEIHKLEPDSITFVDHPKYYQKVINSIARVIIINKEVDCPKGKALLVTKNPFELYNTLALKARPFLRSSSSVSSTAQIGEDTIIQPNVFIGKHVKIGKNCIVHPNVSIYNYTEIGNNVIIHANTTIGGDAFYLHKNGEEYEKMHTIGKTIIEDDVEIGSSCTIDSGVSGDTIIGKGSKLDSQVHIAHGVVVGKNCLLCAQVAVAGKSIIEDDVILYGKVGISKDVRIGKGAVLLASSNVDKNLEGGKTYYGSPAIEARKKWKEMAATRMLPQIWDKLMLKE